MGEAMGKPKRAEHEGRRHRPSLHLIAALELAAEVQAVGDGDEHRLDAGVVGELAVELVDGADGGLGAGDGVDDRPPRSMLSKMMRPLVRTWGSSAS